MKLTIHTNEPELENYFIEQLESEGGKFIKSDELTRENFDAPLLIQ
ncbi:MAG: hypothetical protein KJ666_06690 [Bacteroidetes bacterium]|nr:hypothetical protein [Bacteroidota bacterium]MBU2584507.1 hypothetical protein [Bacteroidota bacterium]